MSRLEDYATKYQCARFERRDGILMANCPRRFTMSAPTATTAS